MARSFWVGEWLVEPDLNSITRANKRVSLEPKVIEVLACLANNPGEVFSKRQILQAVWPGTYVGEPVLRYCISELRKAFDDNPKDPAIVQTVARKGYRLIAQVSNSNKPDSQESIAVLAFADMSSSGDLQYFCDGISEEIINSLAQVRGLRVSSRTSSFAFKSKADDVRLIGQKLGVSTVLEGSVRRERDQLRITAQWINAEDGCHIWSERLDREMKDIFTLQDEIAERIASMIKIKMCSPEISDNVFPPY